MNQLIYATMLAAGIVAVAAPGMIKLLRRMRAGQPIRKDGPQTHAVKAGTPTMGGVLMILGVTVAALFLATPGSPVVAVLLTAMIGYGLIGLWDDVMKVVNKRSLGIKARLKLVLQLVVAAVVAFYAYSGGGDGTAVLIPFTGQTWIMPAPLFFILAVGTIIASSNAVNITDGLDGLAGGSAAIVSLVFVLISWQLGAFDAAIFAAALVGACGAFLWFNAHPAGVIMGDTGSMALGAAIGSLAVVTGTPFILFIAGGLFVIETLSVIIQVLYFRKTGGKRLFKMSPLHHHFELVGWAEPKITVRFWLISVIFGLIALLALN